MCRNLGILENSAVGFLEISRNHVQEFMCRNFYGVPIMCRNLGIPAHGCAGFYAKGRGCLTELVSTRKHDCAEQCWDPANYSPAALILNAIRATPVPLELTFSPVCTAVVSVSRRGRSIGRSFNFQREAPRVVAFPRDSFLISR